MSRQNVDISIVVSCYTMDRYSDTIELINSLNVQTYSSFELLIIGEKSKELLDRLQAYIKANKIVGKTIILFNTGPEGLSYARNIGIENARGNIIAFIDDDAIASPDWLKTIALALKDDENAIGITGPIQPRWENEKMQWVPREFYWMFACTYRDNNLPVKVRNGYGTNMVFRREAFNKAGLFKGKLGAKGGGEKGKHELIGEDTEFSMRVAGKTGKYIIYHPDVMVYHKAYAFRLKWKFIISRTYWEGYTKAVFKKLKYSDHQKNNIDDENRLLQRILFKLLPSSIIGLFKTPIISWKRIRLIAVALTCVAWGYIRGSVSVVELEES